MRSCRVVVGKNPLAQRAQGNKPADAGIDRPRPVKKSSPLGIEADRRVNLTDALEGEQNTPTTAALNQEVR